MKKILQFFKDLPIRRKILITYLAITLLPVLLLGYFSINISTNMIIEKSLKSSSENLLLINRNLDSLTNSLQFYSTTLSLMINSDLVNENLSINSVLNEQNIQNRINKTFNSIVLAYSNLSSGMFVCVTGSIYGNEYRPREINSDILHSKIVQETTNSDGNLVWFDIQKRDYLNQEGSDRDKYILTVGKKVINLDSGTALGSLVLNVTEDMISSTYKDLKLGKTGKYYIVNNDGIIVSSQSKADIMTPLDSSIFTLLSGTDKGGKVKTINGKKKMLISYTNCQTLSWKLVGIVPLNELISESERITLVIVTTALICLLLSIATSLMLSNFIAKPIKKLMKFAKKVTKGDLAIRLGINSKDEVGQLGEDLNYMISYINQLISDIYIEQKKEKDLELKVLQMQINPHFLYNTLDSLHWKLVMSSQLESADIVVSLSNLLRYSINKDNGLARIEDELKQFNNYISIQKLRFSNKIEFVMSIDEDIMDFSIPKLTLQPIVENAINHGIRHKSKYGEIRISGKLDGEYVVIIIEDNGIGISMDDLQQIKERTYLSKGTGMGINNVNDRIEILLGLKKPVTIISEPGIGTKVEIRLPQIKWEGKK